MRNMIIASTSTLYGSGFLEYLTPILDKRLNAKGIKELLFIPFARPGGITHEEYTAKAQKALESLNIKVSGVHEYDDHSAAIEKAPAIFTGGGNTFQLIKTLHDLNLIPDLRSAVYSGTFYLGTSAGSNVCGLNIRTTNDMPIVQPSSFKAMGAVAYNINPHYQDPLEDDTHMGETREQRIKEFHFYNSIPVVGLREGSYIDVQNDQELLAGPHSARVFRKDQLAVEVEPGTDLSQLLKIN